LEQFDNHLKLYNLYHQLKKEILSHMLRWLQSRKGIRHRWYVVVLESIAPPSQVIGLFQNHLNVNVTTSDVAETRRLPEGRNDWVRLVIVHFDNRRARDLIYSARRKLRNARPVPTPIYINEQRTVISYFGMQKNVEK